MKVKQILNEGYLAFTVPAQARKELAKRFPPKYPEFIGHHITSVFGVSSAAGYPTGQIANIVVVGYAEEDGLEALVVTVNGEKRRPDGKRYHITWSLDRSKGKKPVNSNDLIARGFTPADPYEFRTELQFYR